jgi:flagellar basal-body rod protein FlgC
MPVGLDSILNTMSSALSAESIRMNITASNLANSGNVGGSEATTYHSKHPVFSEIKQKISGLSMNEQSVGGVQVKEIINSTKKLDWRFEPDNPLADKEGKVYLTDVDSISEMTDMIAASKEYHADLEVMNTTKSLMIKTIRAMTG